MYQKFSLKKAKNVPVFLLNWSTGGISLQVKSIIVFLF